MAGRGQRLGAIGVIAALLINGCGSSAATPSPSPTISPSASPSPTERPTGASGITLRWFVGLDLGISQDQVAAEKAFVTSYNSFNKEGVTLKLEVQPNAVAADVLKNEIAAGNAPDIVGPLGVGDFNDFENMYLDLSSQIKANQVDLGAYDQPVVTLLQQGDQGQLGIPYLVFPGYVWYNKDIFGKAGLPNLPIKVGDTYQDQPWDWNAMAKIAQQLTVDKTGKKSTDAGFDPKNIVRYGIDFMGTDFRRLASGFGSGSLVGTDGKTAQIPAAWADGLNWYYTGILGAHPYVPSAAAEASALLASGNSPASGNVAMNVGWTSSLASIAADAKSAKVKSWDIGVMPSWKGSTTSPVMVDTFAITKASRNPDAAFKAMLSIMADPGLLKAYGAEPARLADQQAWFDGMNQTLTAIFPGLQVTWSVLGEMARVPATPSFEGDLPAFAQASADYSALLVRLQTTPGLDVIAELTKLQTKLQADFDATAPIVAP